VKNIYISIIILFLSIVIKAQELDTGLTFQQKKYNSEQIDSIYQLLEPGDIKPRFKVFYGGIKGYGSLMNENKIQNFRYLTLIDFSLSSKVRRLWVIDLETMNIVHHSLVSHGKNSGEEYAVNFSNTPNSYMSSIGFF
jgi:hypothetical protein